MKRVCHITTVHAVDDTRILHKECVSLLEAGHDVTLIAPHDGDTVLEGVRVVALERPPSNRLHRMAQWPRAAYRAALAQDADLYHLHDPELLPWGVLLERAGKRVVYDAHEDVPVQILHKYWIPRATRRAVARTFAAVEAACISRFSGVVAVNEQILARLSRHQPRGAVVANYPRLAELRPGPWAERASAACYVGSITRVRGAVELVDAMAHVDAELRLAGDFSPPELRDQLERSPGWERVRYLGRLDRASVASLLQGVKVGVIPLQPIQNYVDAYPVKLFEYMAAGIPVVATDVPRWREVLDGHGCGVSFPAGRPDRLGAAVDELLRDDERARSMGENGRRAVEERYSWETQAQALLRLYDEILA